MAGKLDEISASIGELRATTVSLGKLLDRHCDDDERRHLENLGTLREIKETLQPLAISHWKRAGAIGLALASLGGVAWLLEQAIGVAVAWVFHR
jgi:hypothetical protein